MTGRRLSPAANAYTLAAAACMSAAIPLAFILYQAALLLPASPAGRRAEYWLWAATTLCVAAVATALSWRLRALASQGLAPSEDKAWRLRAGHRVVWTLHLAHEPAPVDPSAASGLRRQVAALFAAAALSWIGAELLWRRRIAVLVESLSAAGRPVTLAALHRGVPKEKNAYPALRAAVTGVKFDYDTSAHPGMKLRKWDEAVVSAESALLGQHEAFLAGKVLPLARAYRDFEPADYRKAAAEPLDANLGSFGGLHQVGNLLFDRAGLKSYKGDAPAAWESADALVRLAAFSGQGGELISKAVAAVLTGRAARACLQIMLNRPGASIPPELARRLAAAEARPYVRDGFAAGLAYSLDVYRAPWRVRRDVLAEQGLDPLQAGTIAVFLELFHLDAAFLARAAAGDKALTDPMGWSPLRAALVARQREREGSLFWQVASVWALGSSGNASLVFARGFEASAWAKLALSHSALNAYRAKHGRYPDRLDALAPALAPLDSLWDPFADRLFAYAVQDGGRGFELSSLGPFKTRSDGSGLAMVLREKF